MRWGRMTIFVGAPCVAALAFLLIPPGERAAAQGAQPTPTQQRMAIRVGETFTVTLEENGTTGFRWQVVQGPDATVVRLVSDTFRPPANPFLVGAAGTRVWQLAAAGAGRTTMRFEYARPFEPGNPPARIHVVDVEVGPRDGSSLPRTGIRGWPGGAALAAAGVLSLGAIVLWRRRR